MRSRLRSPEWLLWWRCASAPGATMNANAAATAMAASAMRNLLMVRDIRAPLSLSRLLTTRGAECHADQRPPSDLDRSPGPELTEPGSSARGPEPVGPLDPPLDPAPDDGEPPPDEPRSRPSVSPMRLAATAPSSPPPDFVVPPEVVGELPRWSSPVLDSPSSVRPRRSLDRRPLDRCPPDRCPLEPLSSSATGTSCAEAAADAAMGFGAGRAGRAASAAGAAGWRAVRWCSQSASCGAPATIAPAATTTAPAFVAEAARPALPAPVAS